MLAKQAVIEAAKDWAASPANRPYPAFAAALMGVAAALERGEPPWWSALARSWRERQVGTERALLRHIVAAVHDQALAGDELLRREFPSCGGAVSRETALAVVEFLAAPPDSFLSSLTGRSVRVFNEYWGSRWIEPARLYFQRRRLPFHLVELNSAAGLGACADLIARGRGVGFDSGLVKARVGLDQAPLDARRDEDARWLLACQFPDDAAGVQAAVDHATALRALFEEDRSLVEVAACAPELAPGFVAKNLPVDPGLGLLLFSQVVHHELPPGQGQAATLAAFEAVAPWGDRGLWINIQRHAEDEQTMQVVAWRPRNGQMTVRVLSSMKLGAAAGVEDAAANAAFLA